MASKYTGNEKSDEPSLNFLIRASWFTLSALINAGMLEDAEQTYLAVFLVFIPTRKKSLVINV